MELDGREPSSEDVFGGITMETIPLLEQKRILLGVTGGIAAYKVCTLASHLTQAGADVDVVMTESATRFVAPLTFEALTGRPAYTSMWRTSDAGLATHIAHVGLADAADLVVIAPATANTMAKLAHGLADNLLSTLALAARCPLLLAPAMDVGMWSHSATQANVDVLKGRGVHVVGPARGRMASGLEGKGRLVEPDEILGHIRLVLGRQGALSGRKVLVTAGPTREFVDPVRFLSNPSSGRQGFALAQAALDHGAEVTLVSGPVDLPTPAGAERVDVGTAEEMKSAVLEFTSKVDILLMAAAPADYRPRDAIGEKIKKDGGDMAIALTPTGDILDAVGERRADSGHPRVMVGFAAETEHVVENARSKLQSKGLDLIVANDVTAPGAGFAVDTNRVLLIGRDGNMDQLPLLSKAAVAQRVLHRAIALVSTKHDD
jgi:phosphopantothenoylcysteine decarboxylase/phosphopantothenate--cysteine ligase